MSLRLGALAALTVSALALPADVLANGRPPGTSTLHFKRGDETKIVAGMSFGLLVSNDNGATWHWMCEDAIGYGGTFDPDYDYAADGTLFATTFNGLLSNTDGCSFTPSVLGTKFISRIAIGTTGRIHATSADDNDGNIYTSEDGGATFPIKTMPGMLKDWWAAVAVAPSDPDIVWISGYRLVPAMPKVHLVFKSTDGGKSFTALAPTSIDDFALMANSTIEIVGFAPANANIVYARVTLEDNSLADALYRSDNGGTSWKRIFGKRDGISFLVRGNGDLVAATQTVDVANGLGAFTSTDLGETWNPLPNPPHISCLVENTAGEVWACTQNYDIPGVSKDGFGIMKSTGTLQTWTGVMRYQDIVGPLACATGTVQHDQCDVKLWCGLCPQVGCDPKRDCPTETVDGPPPDAPQMIVKPKPESCCGASSGSSSLMLGGFIGVLLLRRRRQIR